MYRAWNIKKILFEKQNGNCQYCGVKMKEITIDHILARIHGGTNAIENLCLCCKWCNTVKSGETEKMFRQFLGFLSVNDRFKRKNPNFPEVKPKKFGGLIKAFNKKTGLVYHQSHGIPAVVPLPEPIEEKKSIPSRLFEWGSLFKRMF
jgi:hypothetical protein